MTLLANIAALAAMRAVERAQANAAARAAAPAEHVAEPIADASPPPAPATSVRSRLLHAAARTVLTPEAYTVFSRAAALVTGNTPSNAPVPPSARPPSMPLGPHTFAGHGVPLDPHAWTETWPRGDAHAAPPGPTASEWAAEQRRCERRRDVGDDHSDDHRAAFVHEQMLADLRDADVRAAETRSADFLAEQHLADLRREG